LSLAFAFIPGFWLLSFVFLFLLSFISYVCLSLLTSIFHFLFLSLAFCIYLSFFFWLRFYLSFMSLNAHYCLFFSFLLLAFHWLKVHLYFGSCLWLSLLGSHLYLLFFTSSSCLHSSLLQMVFFCRLQGQFEVEVKLPMQALFEINLKSTFSKFLTHIDEK
jgi:hypothetical protein